MVPSLCDSLSAELVQLLCFLFPLLLLLTMPQNARIVNFNAFIIAVKIKVCAQFLFMLKRPLVGPNLMFRSIFFCGGAPAGTFTAPGDNIPSICAHIEKKIYFFTQKAPAGALKINEKILHYQWDNLIHI